LRLTYVMTAAAITLRTMAMS